MPLDRDYLDARFDGLSKLLETQESNLKGYISAVSENVKTVRKDLQDHKDTTEAHGLGAREKNGSAIVAWGGLATAIAACAVALWKHG